MTAARRHAGSVLPIGSWSDVPEHKRLTQFPSVYDLDQGVAWTYLRL